MNTQLLPIHQGPAKFTWYTALKTASGIVSTNEDKAKSLNDYFVSVFTIKNESTIPVILPSIYLDMPTFEVTSPGVCKLFSGLDSKKSLSEDNISPGVMKETCNEISEKWTFIYNQSLNSGVVPTDWHIANIFALHKKGTPQKLQTYLTHLHQQ